MDELKKVAFSSKTSVGDLNNTGKDLYNIFNTAQFDGTATLSRNLVPYPDKITDKGLMLNNNINITKSLRPKAFMQTFNKTEDSRTSNNQPKQVSSMNKQERVIQFKQEYENL